jgi:hypothetical protein
MEPCNGGMKASAIVAWEVVTQTLPENNDDRLTQRTRAVYPNHNRCLCLPYAGRSKKRPPGLHHLAFEAKSVEEVNRTKAFLDSLRDRLSADDALNVLSDGPNTLFANRSP